MKRILLCFSLFISVLIYSAASGKAVNSIDEISPGALISAAANDASGEDLQASDEEAKVIFYPNPTKDYLNVKFSERGDHLIHVYNMVGEEVMHKRTPDGN